MSVWAGWGVAIGYAFGFLYTWRRMAWLIAWDGSFNFGNSKPRGDDILFAILFGAFIATMWPAVWPIYGIVWLSRDGFGFLVAPKWKQRELDLKAREERIKSLERQVGIRA